MNNYRDRVEKKCFVPNKKINSTLLVHLLQQINDKVILKIQK